MYFCKKIFYLFYNLTLYLQKAVFSFEWEARSTSRSFCLNLKFFGDTGIAGEFFRKKIAPVSERDFAYFRFPSADGKGLTSKTMRLTVLGRRKATPATNTIARSTIV